MDKVNKDKTLMRKIERLGDTLGDIVAKAQFYAAQFDDKLLRDQALTRFHAKRKREG